LETQYGAFSRTFFLPDNVNPAQIDAHFDNGILNVIVPKDEQKVKKHQIQIK
ncbi:MAG: Hsp20/alpha crystallin family protein, partial [Bacteroidota bacterium]|nr:Hsp20/alpha crystallin family protein [Bacteroidota bacterium]